MRPPRSRGFLSSLIFIDSKLPPIPSSRDSMKTRLNFIAVPGISPLLLVIGLALGPILMSGQADEAPAAGSNRGPTTSWPGSTGPSAIPGFAAGSIRIAARGP